MTEGRALPVLTGAGLPHEEQLTHLNLQLMSSVQVKRSESPRSQSLHENVSKSSSSFLKKSFVLMGLKMVMQDTIRGRFFIQNETPQDRRWT